MHETDVELAVAVDPKFISWECRIGGVGDVCKHHAGDAGRPAVGREQAAHGADHGPWLGVLVLEHIAVGYFGVGGVAGPPPAIRAGESSRRNDLRRQCSADDSELSNEPAKLV